jgi:phenylalanyl-tRNA synthetase alpha chain
MDLSELVNAATGELSSIDSADQLEAFRVKYLGAKGLLKQASDQIKQIPADQKRAYGQVKTEKKTKKKKVRR